MTPLWFAKTNQCFTIQVFDRFGKVTVILNSILKVHSVPIQCTSTVMKCGNERVSEVAFQTMTRTTNVHVVGVITPPLGCVLNVYYLSRIFHLGDFTTWKVIRKRKEPRLLTALVLSFFVMYTVEGYWCIQLRLVFVSGGKQIPLTFSVGSHLDTISTVLTKECVELVS